MKRCPECQRGYGDEIFYCLTDGTYLSPVSNSVETATIQFPESITATPPQKTLTAIQFSKATAAQAVPPAQTSYHKKVLLIGVVLVAVGIAWAIAVVVNQRADRPSTTAADLPSHTPTPTPEPVSKTKLPAPPPDSNVQATVLYAGTEGLVVRTTNNVRSGRVADVFYGDRVKVLLYIDDWAKIETESGRVGFVRSKYLSILRQ